MTRVVVGDIHKSKAQTLVNTVNCIGVMGKGVALGFKKRFPDMYDDYVRRCREGKVRLGRPYLYRPPAPPWVLNFPTKEHWRSVARLQDIIEGLEYLESHYRQWGITSLAVPPLGCGQGQLEWRVVGRTLYRHLKRLSIPVELYAPHGTPPEQLQLSFLEQPGEDVRRTKGSAPPVRVEPSWVALSEILARIEKEPYHWPIGRVTFQKLAYFATQAGLPTGLRFKRASFGPFAPDVKSLVTRLVNNGLIREELMGRMFRVRIGPTYHDAKQEYNRELDPWEPIIRKIVDLFLRMRTWQAEMAATVHFAMQSLIQATGRKPSEKEVLAEVLNWKQRHRPPLDEAQVALTIRNLSMLGWLDVNASVDLPVPEETMVNV